MKNQIELVTSLIKDIKFCMFTTKSEEGKLYSRPMGIIQDEINLSEGIYFFTRDDAPKSKEIEEDNQVNVSFSHPTKNNYVSLSGVAKLSKDQEKIKTFWKPIYQAWFPEGLNDPHLCLIHFKPEELEYWESPTSPVVKILNLVKIVSGKAIDVGENEKLKID